MTNATQEALRADDYLRDYAERATSPWLKALVEAVVALRVRPRAVVLDAIFEQFLVDHQLRDRSNASSLAPLPKRDQTTGSSDLILKSITHTSGVNALAADATLPFHPKLTVVYGKNGSGKSGFVRILKRLAGSRTQEDIWQNVRQSKSQNRCRGTMVYTSGGKDTPYDWKGDADVSPFTRLGVFDGKCVSLYLTESLALSYQPYGFELFQILADSLKALQERLTRIVADTRQARPYILFCDEDTPAGQFLKGVTARTTSDQLDAAATWDRKAQNALAARLKDRSRLQNPSDQQELLRNRLNKVRNLENALEHVRTDLSVQNIKIYAGLAKRLATLSKQRQVKKGKTLEDYAIPGMDLEEWEQFIGAGEDFILASEHEEYPAPDGACIYCQQGLSRPAHRLLQLYRDLYRAEDTTDLDAVAAKLEEVISDLEAASYTASLSHDKDDFKGLLPEGAINGAFLALAAADAFATRTAQALRNRTPLPRFAAPKLATSISATTRAKAKIQVSLKAVADAQVNLAKRTREIDKSIATLKNTQKLAKQRALVERYIELDKWAGRAAPLSTHFNTKPITDLGKKAWNELVSKAFVQRFDDESHELHAPAVALAFRGEYGSQVRDKSMEGMTDIEEILSEGEQKAVALADFLAERAVENDTTPIILDDPATSFDHERKQLIAKRLVTESKTRQVIVFTHDLMFASYLREHVEGPNGELIAANAAFHDIHARPTTTGIVTLDYYPGAVKFDQALKKVEAMLPQLSSAKGEMLADGLANAYSLLRRAVEKAVEERIFGRVINRWSDQIQLFNVPRASLSREKLDTAKKLHEEFSAFIEAHNQSNEMIEHMAPDVDRLKADIARVKEIGVR